MAEARFACGWDATRGAADWRNTESPGRLSCAGLLVMFPRTVLALALALAVVVALAFIRRSPKRRGLKGVTLRGAGQTGVCNLCRGLGTGKQLAATCLEMDRSTADQHNQNGHSRLPGEALTGGTFGRKGGEISRTPVVWRARGSSREKQPVGEPVSAHQAPVVNRQPLEPTDVTEPSTCVGPA